MSEEDCLQSVCRESFFNFLKQFWSVVCMEDPIWNWHIEYLCNELQVVAERVFRNEPKLYDLIINISPGSTKSIICSQAFPAWVWTRMRTARFIGASYAHSIAVRHALKNRDIVQSKKYQDAFDVGPMREDQNAKSLFMNQYGGERQAVGTGGSITGNHAHFLLVDDPLNPEEAASPAELENCKRFMMETLPTRVVNKEVCPLILIMQRLHQGDPTGHLLKQSGEETPVRHICLPAEETEAIRPRRLRNFYKDGLMDPMRAGRKVLKAMRKKLGEYGYAGQFLQNPVPPEGGQFKVERLRFDTPPHESSFEIICRAWDKAATAGGGDYTVGVKIGKDKHGRFWILDVVRGQWDTFEVERQIKFTAELDGKNVIICVVQDPGAAGKKSSDDTVRMLAGWVVVVSKPTGDKQLRARPFSSQVNGNNVWVRKDAPWVPELIEEYRYFPFGVNDDQVDASADSFNVCNEGVIKVGGW